MKSFVAVMVAVALVAVYAADEKKTTEERPKTFRRLIPADVLRGKEPSVKCDVSKSVCQNLVFYSLIDK